MKKRQKVLCFALSAVLTVSVACACASKEGKASVVNSGNFVPIAAADAMSKFATLEGASFTEIINGWGGFEAQCKMSTELCTQASKTAVADRETRALEFTAKAMRRDGKTFAAIGGSIQKFNLHNNGDETVDAAVSYYMSNGRMYLDVTPNTGSEVKETSLCQFSLTEVLSKTFAAQSFGLLDDAVEAVSQPSRLSSDLHEGKRIAGLDSSGGQNRMKLTVVRETFSDNFAETEHVVATVPTTVVYVLDGNASLRGIKLTEQWQLARQNPKCESYCDFIKVAVDLWISPFAGELFLPTETELYRDVAVLQEVPFVMPYI